MMPVVLASASPRRAELLRRILAEFEIVPAEVDEDALGDADPWVAAQRLAREKALTVAGLRPEALVIGGDTIVAVDGLQLGKPKDAADARRMLGLLSGREHAVVTGVALRWPAGFAAFTETSKVTFRPLNDIEIAAYVETGEPLDKAGAYAIQGGAMEFVERLEGSLDNVIGLPTERLIETLREVKLSLR
jgi:septum formation protein